MGIFRQFPYSNFHEMNMDDILKIVKTMSEEWEATKTEWASYKEFIDNYFANLDVSEEVLEALRVFAADGTLNTIMDPTIASATTTWLAEHITQPVGVVIDTSLTVGGACADAKATGDRIAHTHDALEMLNDSDNIDIELSWELGALSSVDGSEFVNPAYARTQESFNCDVMNKVIIGNTGNDEILISAYNYLNGEYVDRVINSYSLAANSTHSFDFSEITGDIRLAVHKSGSPDITIGEANVVTLQYITGNTRSINFKYRVAPTVNAFSDITDVGMYIVASDDAGRLSDSPTTTGGVLIVAQGTGTIENVSQFYIPAAADYRIYFRHSVSASWVTTSKESIGTARALTAEDTFGALNINGVYISSNAVMAAISDAPTTYGGFLIVARSWIGGTPMQFFFPNNGDFRWYWRYSLTSSWNESSKETVGTARLLTSDDLLDNIKVSGVYGLSNTVAAAISDSPTNYGGNLVVFRSNNGGTAPITQIYFTNEGDQKFYLRYGTYNNWYAWRPVTKGLTVSDMQTLDYFVQTCVEKPITLDSTTHIALFSDSIGTTTHGGFTWASLIEDATGCTIDNYSIGGAAFVVPVGETSIIEEINGVSDWTGVNMVIVAAGTNDAAYNTTAADLKTAIANVITAISTNAPDAKIIFITPIQKKGSENYELPAIAGAICNIALKNGCSVINGFDFPIPTASNDWVTDFTDNDGIHPNTYGKHVYAQSVLNALL